MKYNTETGKFIDSEGDEVDNSLIGAVNLTEGTNWNMDGSESELLADKELCVAISISFEFEEQLPCKNPSTLDCKWNFFRYVPANCNNYHGSICQHWDHLGSMYNIDILVYFKDFVC